MKNSVKQYYAGIDVGGTFIKGALVSAQGEIIVSSKIPTECGSGDRLAELICTLYEELLEKAQISKDAIGGMGIGIPGMVDKDNGVIVCAENLRVYGYALSKRINEMTGLKCSLANDASAAALGEALFGAGKSYKNSVMVTLGTGVGGGIIIDGKLFEGNMGAGAEIGHAVILHGGEKCACGRRGCFEQYASASALIRETKKAMLAHKDSALWQIGTPDAVSGKTAFDFKDTDPYAKEVVDTYIEMLASGLASLANVFRPEVIILGGGVCAQGENLLAPLRKRFCEELFAAELGPKVEIIVAERGNDAGCLGAAALIFN